MYRLYTYALTLLQALGHEIDDLRPLLGELEEHCRSPVFKALRARSVEERAARRSRRSDTREDNSGHEAVGPLGADGPEGG